MEPTTEPTTEPETDEGVPPASATESHLPEAAGTMRSDTYEDYVKYGISAKGLRHVVTEFAIDAATSTSQLCQTVIKPHTATPGWTDEPQLIVTDERGNDVSANHWYTHSYVRQETGERQAGPPDGTRSMCELLEADQSTAHFVAKPTHFLSHAGPSYCSTCSWPWRTSWPTCLRASPSPSSGSTASP